jgi:chaperone modulatory protein CbpM
MPKATLRTVALVHLAFQSEARLSAAQFAAAVGIRPARLARLVQLGIVEPSARDGSEFHAAEVGRLRRTLRLQRDLGVDLASAAIISELVERLEHLEGELTRLRGGA